jgi:hypothetical protein
VEEGGQLGSETEDGDNGLDGGGELLDEDLDENKDTVNVTVSDGDADRGGQGGDDLGDVDLDTLNEVDDLGIGVGLLDLTGLELGKDDLYMNGSVYTTFC